MFLLKDNIMQIEKFTVSRGIPFVHLDYINREIFFFEFSLLEIISQT